VQIVLRAEESASADIRVTTILPACGVRNAAHSFRVAKIHATLSEINARAFDPGYW
jgi:hypothetical protein